MFNFTEGGVDMVGKCLNPYLPCYEYIPDGEPHVFGDRIYVLEAMTNLMGRIYENDYVCWSAPVNDCQTGDMKVLSIRRHKICALKRNHQPMPDKVKGTMEDICITV